MPDTLIERLRACGFVPPDYAGGGLLNLAATVLDLLGVREEDDPPPLAPLDRKLRTGVRQIVLVVADGLGLLQLRRLSESGDVPFISSLLDRARRGAGVQLIEATTVFPSTTVAAITTLNTARTPQEHGNIAYFVWLEEFAQVTQMLRWGAAIVRRGSYFEDPDLDPRTYAHATSLHQRLRERGRISFIVEPEMFQSQAMTRMHAAQATYAGYLLPSTMGVRLAQLLERAPWGDAPAYVYAYWAGIDTVAHWHGPGSPEEAAEAAQFDQNLSRAFARGGDGDTLVILTADHGHAATDPEKLVDLEGDAQLRGLLRNPIAGEPRLAFLHTDQPERVKQHLARRYGDIFFVFDRDEAIAAGLFGRGDPDLARRRIGEVCAMPQDDRAATIVRVEGQVFRHRGSHGGMSPAEMRIPVLAWRV